MTPRDIMKEWYQGQTLVWGHRGAQAYAPMNTLPAFELAIQQGAQGIELDIHRSKDGYPVVVHDFTVDHTTNVTGRVADFTLAELKALDAGTWFGAAFAGVTIPTLDEVFDLVGPHIIVNVEIKSESLEPDGVEEAVADCLQRYPAARAIVSSFNPVILKRFRQIMPHMPLAYLDSVTYTPPGFGTEAAILREDCEAWHSHHTMTDALYMAQANALNKFVHVWTVNDPQRARELRDLGVHALITDTPDVILKALRE